jgi:hypothetical protein
VLNKDVCWAPYYLTCTPVICLTSLIQLVILSGYPDGAHWMQLNQSFARKRRSRSPRSAVLLGAWSQGCGIGYGVGTNEPWLSKVLARCRPMY